MYHRYMDPHTQPFNPQIPPNSYPCQYYTSNHPSGFAHHPHLNHAEHSGCCNYSHPPGCYGFGPHYTCTQPSTPLHYHAPYPPHPYAYPAYSVPPPHYTLDQPRYDYDKTKHHCCGCPNHTCLQKGDKPDSSNLIRTPNYPFPVFWVPPEYMKDKENSNGYVPLDINSPQETGQEGHEKKQPTSPIIWMPGFDKPMELVKDVKENNPNVEEWPSKFKIVPLKLLENKDGDEKSSIEEDAAKAPKEKENRIKIIPLKLLENEDKDKKSIAEEYVAKVPKEKESRIKIVPVKHLEEMSENTTNVPEKPKDMCELKTASDKKQTMTGKSSKLPPVCLRVDPLPRRKANGASRSPSPPGAKGERAHQQDEAQTSKVSADANAKGKDIPVTAVKDKVSSQEEKEQNCKSNEVNLQAKEKVADAPKHAEGGNMEGKKGRKTLSQSDAAIAIQSAYRGFEVRRWQPLDKLRKIAKIREQTANIGGQIETFTQGKDSKQRIVMGETIMNLLLQLDTIQGLHPFVREARKTVARELVCLQEKLDSLSSPPVEDLEDHETSKVSDDCSFPDTKPDVMQESSGETTVSVGCVDTFGELAKIEDISNAIDSYLTEPASDQGSKQPEEANGDADRTYDNKESSTSVGDEVATIADSFLATLPVSEKESSTDNEGATMASPSLATVRVPEKASSMTFDNEVAAITSPSLVPAPEEVSNMSSDNEVAIIASPYLVTVPAAQGKMDKVEVGNNVPVVEENVEGVETTANVDELPLSSTEALIDGQFSNEPGKQQESTDPSGRIPDVSEHCQEHEAVKEEVVDSEYLDDMNVVHDVEKLPVQSLGEEALAIASKEDKIDHEMDGKPLELKKDADAPVEIQALLMADETCDVNMSAEGEDGGMGIDRSCPEHDVRCNNHVAAMPENPILLDVTDHVKAEAPVARGDAVYDIPVGVIADEKKLIEENGKLKEMLEKLLEAGKEQLGVISDLNGRVKDLERKLAQKKRMKAKRNTKRNKQNQRSVSKLSHINEAC